MLRALITMLSFLGLAACLAASTTPAAADEPEYALAATAPTLKAGMKGAITIKVDVKGGYHWNPDYPAKFELSGAPTELGLTKLVYEQLKSDFKAKSQTAVAFDIETTPKAAARGEVSVSAKFSVCNERVCLIKTAKTKVPVVVAR